MCEIGRGSLIGESAQIGARTQLLLGGVEVEPGLRVPADSLVPAGTRLNNSNAKSYSTLEPPPGLEPTVTPREHAEKAEIAKERSGAGVAVRGAGREVGGTRTPTPEKDIARPSGRAH